MNVSKGIKDPETGELYLVQAAGTTYNDVQNSMSFGNNTIAAGPNQIVSGRNNVPDVEGLYAEIVGGGSMYSLGDVIVPGDKTDSNNNNNYDMLYAGHGLDEFKRFLQTFYNADLTNFSIADERRTAYDYIGARRVTYNIPNVADYDKLYFVVFEENVEENMLDICVYGYSIEDEAIYQPFSEVQGHFIVTINGGVKTLSNVGDDMTLRNLLYPVSKLSTTGNFYLSFMAIKNSLKNIRTLDWHGNQWNAGDMKCTDEEGGTISMRELSNEVKTLKDAEDSDTMVVETENIEALSGEVIESLKAGDVVLKSDSSGKHSYRVSFKNATGMCLTYVNAENVETIAYDKTDDTWAKTDKTVTPIANRAAANHTHAIADVDGLQAALNAKAGNYEDQTVKIPFVVDNGALALSSEENAYDDLFALHTVGQGFPDYIQVFITVYDSNNDFAVPFAGVCRLYDNTAQIAATIYVGNYRIAINKNVSTGVVGSLQVITIDSLLSAQS